MTSNVDAAPAAATAARDHCLAPGRSEELPGAGRYVRLFEELPALRDGEAFFREQGRRAVAGEDSPFVDDDDAEPVDAGCVAAGWPVFAQFLAHDLTADRSPLVSVAEVASLRNVRAARLNLESVHGRGPGDQPYLYMRDDPAKLLLGANDAGRHEDVPRNPEGIALLGDQRNDVHQPISQLHVAVVKTHNRLVDRLREDGVPDSEVFAEAQRALRWHVQWIVLHDFLPGLVGRELAEAIRDGDRRWYRPKGAPALPVEFADAAFRYGHSQVRERYRLNATMPPTRLFPGLVGFGPVPDAHVADWAQLFDLPGRPRATQRSRRIDGRLVPSLINLPEQIVGDVEASEHRSLAIRDLQRGVATGLPSGEAVAAAVGEQPLEPAEVGVRDLGWTWETPLWFYILKEAEVRTGGERLGPVGGRIVAEVLTAVIDLDMTSYRACDPGWTPTLPEAGAFGLGDLLAFAEGLRRSSTDDE